MVALTCLCGCGSVPDEGLDGSEVLTTDGGLAIPRGRADLVTIARSGAYLQWPREPAVHASAGPHGGGVRTFVNPILRESLRTGARTHPVGSVVVKELYSGDQLAGYAVDAKRGDGTWLFLEGFEPAFEKGSYFVGTSNSCASCHAAGVDFVLTQPGDW